jgi:hypothetical protein
MKLLVSLKLGTPLSVTLTVMANVPGPWDSFGVQVSTPVLGLMFAPEGGDTRLNVRVFTG